MFNFGKMKDDKAKQKKLAEMRAFSQKRSSGGASELFSGAENERGEARCDAVGKEEIAKALSVLEQYKRDKEVLESRILEEEKWYNLRHWEIISGANEEKRPQPTSAWLFNAISNKHADIMDNIPEPNILPREKGDEEEARTLSAIIPAICSRCGFEDTYSRNAYAKLKHGSAVYATFWNNDLEDGLGDVDISPIDMFNIFCDMSVSDIQKSKNLFVLSLCDLETLEAEYPEHKGKFKSGGTFNIAKHAHMENIDSSDKVIVYDWYYKVLSGNRTIVHYVKFANDIVLYATENTPSLADIGLYESGEYPVTVDNLFPIPSCPFGFGLIAIMKSPQMYIDKLDQLLLENAALHAKPRYFTGRDDGVNEQEFLDMSKTLVHVEGGVGEDRLRPIEIPSISQYAMNMLEYKINELKETAANNDANNGSATSGVTSGAAISALQEAGNKQSRDIISASYRAYTDIVYKIIELIRQFYTEERSFRITGESGENKYISYSNQNLKQPLEGYFGEAMGDEVLYKKPVFDIDVKAQKKSAYSKLSQNSLAQEMYQMGFFNPELAQQSLSCIEMMDFDGKEKVKSMISQGHTLYQQLLQTQEQLIELQALLGLGQGGEPMRASSQAMPAPGGKAEAEQLTYGERLAKNASVNMINQ